MMDGRIFKLKEELINNLQHQWKVEEMAEFTELSMPHFQKLFKVNIGIPPIEYLRNLRLEKAREFLETNFWHIQQVRIEVGMPDDSHFTRDFRKKFGVTPTEYRKLYWEKSQSERSKDKK